MQIAINNVARTELAMAGAAQLPMSYKEDKNGNIKTGSFARAIAFASREVRLDASRALYLKWLSNGQYRPVVNDMVDAIVPKSAQPFVRSMAPASGPISKDMFVSLCTAVCGAIEATGKEPKGQKAFFHGIAKYVVESTRADAGEGDVVGEQ
jgi:hypothetical protein